MLFCWVFSVVWSDKIIVWGIISGGISFNTDLWYHCL